MNKILRYCILQCDPILMMVIAIGCIFALAFLCLKYGKDQHKRMFKYPAFCIGGVYWALIVCRLVLCFTFR